MYSNWESIMAKRVPKEVKELCKTMSMIEPKINFRDSYLRTKTGRKYCRNKMLDVQSQVSKNLKVFHSIVMNGTNSKTGDKAKEIKKAFKSMEKARTNILEDNSESSFMNKVPQGQGVKIYKNLMNKIARELIFNSLKKASKDFDDHEEFYRNLFDEVWEWSTIQTFRSAGSESSEEVEEGIDEVDEDELLEELAR